MMRSLFEAPAISVGELCRRIRIALRQRFPSPVRVVGEISKCTRNDGHFFFALKDAEGLIQCVLFRDDAVKLGMQAPLIDGLAVEVAGLVDVYKPRSAYQIVVQDIVPVGRGALYVEFERLKERLRNEGLFEEDRKRPIPSFISEVAIVTSKATAALQDFLTVSRRRGAYVRITVVPAPVQGAAAAPALARAIRRAGRLPVDVVVVARGGGSPEDLWAFNTEVVARAIVACEKPVLTAIGHQTDVTIADFVADRSVPTPTAAAELVAKERAALLERIALSEQRMQRSLLRVLDATRAHFDRASRGVQRAGRRVYELRAQRFNELEAQLRRCDPRRQLDAWRGRTHQAVLRLPVVFNRLLSSASRKNEQITLQLHDCARRLMSERQRELELIDAKLQTLGPRQTLRRGYAIAYDAKGSILTDASSTRVGERIGVELHNGWLGAQVQEKRKGS